MSDEPGNKPPENETRAFVCKANRTADPPQDCDWPHCGCDPAATKVLEALQEEGWRPPARTGRSPGDLSPEEFQQAWRDANAQKASEQPKVAYNSNGDAYLVEPKAECAHEWVTAIAAPNMGRCKRCGVQMPSQNGGKSP